MQFVRPSNQTMPSSWAPFMRPVMTSIMLVGLCLGQSSCVGAYIQSVGGESTQVHERIFITDFNTAWQATLDALKNARLDQTNREGGYIQSKWTDNTAEKNLTDSFGNADSLLKAQSRFRVTVSKGTHHGNPTVKVSVQKEQMVQRDVLEGWHPIKTDSIDETTLLYRIGRIIYVRTKLTQLEEKKANEAISDLDSLD